MNSDRVERAARAMAQMNLHDGYAPSNEMDVARQILAAADVAEAREDAVLVPRKPTEAMIAAGVQVEYLGIDNGGDSDHFNVEDDTARSVYAAMIAAAPSPDGEG